MKQNIAKAFVSFRIGPTLWRREERFAELLRLFRAHAGVTDEIALFSHETHAPLPLAAIAERAGLLRERMRMARADGLRAGINLLTTIGHHEENRAQSLSADFTPMTDSHGRVCRGSFCPNDPRMGDYVEQVYRLLAQADPDFIWVDDDVRLFGHSPAIETCFCARCLDLFEKETGVRYTGDALREAFNGGETAAKLKVRRAWLQHNRDTIVRLLQRVECAAHAVKPGLPLGLMTGERYYEGYAFASWAEALSGPGQAPVMWRPGGNGFGTDDSPITMFGKSHPIGRQVAALPDQVVSIQSEIENFPYQMLKKSPCATTLEAATHIAAGCTGAAFNVLSMYDEPLDEYAPMVGAIRAARPFLDLLARTFGRSPARGVYTGWTRDSFAAANCTKDNWFDPEFWRMMGDFAGELLELGIPCGYAPKDAPVTLWTGDAPLAMPLEDVVRTLSAGVYMDAAALAHVNAMGHADLTGFEIARTVEADAMEEFTSDTLNGRMAGRQRDGRQSFWKQPAAMLKPRCGTARSLARALDYAGTELGACCAGVFENRLGGRVCVAGYYPWAFLQNLSKSVQIKNLLRWLSRDSLPAYVESFHKAGLWVREPEPGRLALYLVNASMEPAENLTIMVRTAAGSLRMVDAACAEETLRAAGRDGAYARFVLPPVAPWQARLLTY
ncbi:MAG: hypothetical protein PHR35_02320 [Kiritimatiellae bacterium]|nr:hypothetical protein [Kiritimatiellia bacterium]